MAKTALGLILLFLAVSARQDSKDFSARVDRFAAIQFSPVWSEPESNRDHLVALIRKAAVRGARYVILPELAVTGIPEPETSLYPFAEPIPGPTSDFFTGCAKALGVWLGIPVVEKAETEGDYYLTTVLLDDRGRVRSTYRKRLYRGHAPFPGMLRGNARAVLDTVDDQGRRIGVLSGHDVQTGVPVLAARGADSILVAAAWLPDEPLDWIQVCDDLSRKYGVNLVVANYSAEEPEVVTTEIRQSLPEIQIGPPLGLPSVPFPAYDRTTWEMVELGRELFFDSGLSRTGTTSCASCHQPQRAFSNGESKGVGLYGQKTQRKVPSLLNVAFRGALFWDGLVSTLENQAKYPINHAQEMDSHYLDHVVNHVHERSDYVRRFRSSFGVDEIRFEHVARVLASYQRTLLSGNSRFDRFYYGGDSSALSPAEKRGFELFTGKARCVQCHTIEPDYALFMDQRYHNTGVGYDSETGRFSDAGLGLLSHSDKSGFFLTPPLRNIALTAPYMHDGSIPTLEDVVHFYNAGGNPNPYLDPAIRPLGLSAAERDDLVHFLRALTGFPAPSDRGPAVTFVASAIEYSPVQGDVGANVRALKKLIRREAEAGAQYIVLPEHAFTGPLTDLRLDREGVDEIARVCREAAMEILVPLVRRLGVWLVFSIPESDSTGGDYFISTVLLNDKGEEALRIRKIAPENGRGDGNAASGDPRRLVSIPSPQGRFGVLSGDDIVQGVPRLTQLGAQTIFVTASWQGRDAVAWTQLAKELALKYSVNLIVSNLRDGGGDRDDCCKSAIVTPDAVRVSISGDDPKALRGSIAERAQPFRVNAPLGLPAVPQPPYVPLTKPSIELGRQLFFDRNLSGDGTVSCATCHDPGKAFTNGTRVAAGVGGRKGKRSVISLLNVAYRPLLLWDGRSHSLESQLEHVIHSWSEMDSTIGRVLQYLNHTPPYPELFRNWTGKDEITFQDVARALANYQKTLVSGNGPFDRYYYGGDEDAMSESARRGFQIFMNKGNCVSCHEIQAGYAVFTDNYVHNTGVGYHERFEYLGYGGDGREENFATRNIFRGEYVTPSLRNVALTAPYMHDGSIDSLEEVIDFYDRGAIPNPFLDRRIRPLGLTAGQKRDLLEFLKALTSYDDFAAAALSGVPSHSAGGETK